MPETSKDHTRSLAPYQNILEAWEAEYRTTPPANRKTVIGKIMEEISAAAAEGKARLADDEILQKQIANFYTNHRKVIKEEDEPPIKAGKQWTARLVAAHYHHNEIMEALKAHSSLAPQQQIGKYATLLTEKVESLSEEDKARYAVLAEQWKEKGPPQEVKRREAEEKTGKYALSVLKQLEQQLGVHAVLFVTYQDTEGEVKISDFETQTQGISAKDRFGHHHGDEVEKFRKKWGRWANKTFSNSQREGEEEDAEEESQPTKNTPSKERFLQKGSDGLWVLGPLPALGAARNTELATSFHTYITQQWKLKKGPKRVMWKDIQEVNGWYISETFLIHGRTLSNPTRLSEKNLRAYWKHWYDLAQSGKPFTFKRVGAHDSDAHGDSDDPEEEGDEQVDNRSKEGDDGEVAKEDDLEDEEKVDDQPGEDDNSGVGSQSGKKNAKDGESEDSGVDSQSEKKDIQDEDADSHPGKKLLTPDQCHSEGEKVAFLHSLVSTNGEEYQNIINIVAQMRVGNSSEVIKYPAKCFSWSWSKSYGDESLHQNAAKLKTLHRWIATDPHLDDSGDLRGRASLLRICLGLGILLGDACRALFTEENQHAPGTPGYLTASIWGPSDYDALMDYTKQLEKELLKDLEVSRHKKRKASTGEPADAKIRAKKVTALPHPTHATGGSEEDDDTNANTNTRKSTRNKKGPVRYQKVETTAVGKGKGKESQRIAGPSKKRVGKD